MTKSSFEFVWSQLIGHEGGDKYTNDPDDPGGPTKYGVTLKTLQAYRRDYGLTADDVKKLNLSTAQAIFKAKYWNTVRADDLPAGLDYAVVDYAFNSGPGQAVKDLQRVLGVRVDGVAAVMTVEAANDGNVLDLIEALCRRRLAFMKSLKGWWKYGRGWSRRVAEVQRQAVKLAQKRAPEVADLETGEAGAAVSAWKLPQIKTASLAGGGLGIAAIGEQAKEASGQIGLLGDAVSWAPTVGVTLAIVAVGIGAYVALTARNEAAPE